MAPWSSPLRRPDRSFAPHYWSAHSRVSGRALAARVLLVHKTRAVNYTATKPTEAHNSNASICDDDVDDLFKTYSLSLTLSLSRSRSKHARPRDNNNVLYLKRYKIYTCVRSSDATCRTPTCATQHNYLMAKCVLPVCVRTCVRVRARVFSPSDGDGMVIIALAAACMFGLCVDGTICARVQTEPN